MTNVDGSEQSGVAENKEDVALLADVEEAGQPKSEGEKTDEKTSSWNEFCEFINTSGKTDNDAIPAGTKEAKEKKDDAVLLVADEEEGRPSAKTADDDDLAIAESGVEGKKEEEAALLGEEEGRPKFILPPNSEDEKTADDDDVAMANSVKWADQQAAIQKRESLIIERKRSLGRTPLLSHHEEEEDVLHFRKRWRWYYAVFFFSTISLLFCFLQCICLRHLEL